MGFHHFIHHNIFVGRPFMHCGFTPFCGGWNAFNSGFNFGMMTSLFNFTMPRFQLQPYFPPVAYNNFYTLTPPTPALPTYSQLSQQNMFNSFIWKPDLTVPSFDSNNFFNFNQTSNSFLNSTSNNVTKRNDNSFQNSDKLDKNFLNRVKQIAQKLNCDYKDLLAVMNSESGISTSRWNGTTAVGLIQFTDPAIETLNRNYGLNLTKDKIAKMSAMEQLDLVEKLLVISKSYNFAADARLSAADLYSIVFLPGRANRNVLCSRGEAYYDQNKGLDKNNDGKITKNDLEQHLASKQVDESLFA